MYIDLSGGLRSRCGLLSSPQPKLMGGGSSLLSYSPSEGIQIIRRYPSPAKTSK